MQLRNKKGGHRILKNVITFESVVVYVYNGHRKWIKRSLNDHGRENLKGIYIAN